MIMRFEAICSCSEPDMRESEFGEYVSFDDHVSTLAAKDAEIAKLHSHIAAKDAQIAKLRDVLLNFTASRDISYVEALKLARAALAMTGEP